MYTLAIIDESLNIDGFIDYYELLLISLIALQLKNKIVVLIVAKLLKMIILHHTVTATIIQNV